MLSDRLTSVVCGGKSICQDRVASPVRPPLVRGSSGATVNSPQMVGLTIVPPGHGAIGLNARARFQAIGVLSDGTARNVTDLAQWSIADTTAASTLLREDKGYVTTSRPGQTRLTATIGSLTTSTEFKTEDCPVLLSTHDTTGGDTQGGPAPTPQLASGHPRCAVRNSQQSQGLDCFGADANDPACALAHPSSNCGQDGQSACFDGTDDGGYCLPGQGQSFGGGGGLGICSTCGALGQQPCGNPTVQLGFCNSPGLNVEQETSDAKCVLPQRVVADADRSVRVIFWNDSDRFLFRWSAHLNHGKFTSSNLYYGTPDVISPHSYVEWGTESDGIGTGTQGYVQYYVSQYGISQGQVKEYPNFQGRLKEYPDLHTMEQYGILEIDWDNPFLGDNSLNESFRPGDHNSSVDNNLFRFEITHVPLDPGTEAMDIPAFFRFRETGGSSHNCNPFWVENELRRTPNDALTDFNRAVASISTPFKQAGISSWVTTGCIGTATGSPVRSAQHGTDGFLDN